MGNQFGQSGIFIGTGETFGFGVAGGATTVGIEIKAGAPAGEQRGIGSMIINTATGKLYITSGGGTWGIVTSV